MNINNWAVNIKGLTIVHRVLRDKILNQSCIKNLQENYINYVIPYHFKNKNQKIRMFADVSEKYAKYLRLYIKYSEVITEPVSDQVEQEILLKKDSGNRSPSKARLGNPLYLCDLETFLNLPFHVLWLLVGDAATWVSY